MFSVVRQERSSIPARLTSRLGQQKGGVSTSKHKLQATLLYLVNLLFSFIGLTGGLGKREGPDSHTSCAPEELLKGMVLTCPCRHLVCVPCGEKDVRTGENKNSVTTVLLRMFFDFFTVRVAVRRPNVSTAPGVDKWKRNRSLGDHICSTRFMYITGSMACCSFHLRQRARFMRY